MISARSARRELSQKHRESGGLLKYLYLDSDRLLAIRGKHPGQRFVLPLIGELAAELAGPFPNSGLLAEEVDQG